MEIWFQDEARLGQKNGLTRLWARKGTRPRQPADQRYRNAYLFGAICPAHGKGAALMCLGRTRKPCRCISTRSAATSPERPMRLCWKDRAGWHTTGKLKVPKNLTIDPAAIARSGTEPGGKYLGSTCAPIGSPTACSDYNAIAMLDAKLGTSSSHSPKPSHQSECENGPISVNVKCRWYNVLSCTPLCDKPC